MKSEIKVALVGNPNSGKTSLFNRLTGERRQTGNYPGVTVQKNEGCACFEGCRLSFADLPGAYSMTPFSYDEMIVRNYIVNERPDVIVNVVDAENLERHLFLTMQLQDLGLPIILAVNKGQAAAKKDIQINLRMLSSQMEMAVIEIEGGDLCLLCKEIKKAALSKDYSRGCKLCFSSDIESAIEQLVELLEVKKETAPRFFAIKLLENDEAAMQYIKDGEILETAAFLRQKLEARTGFVGVAITEQIYRYIGQIGNLCVCYPRCSLRSLSEYADRLFLHRYLGLPIFFAMMFAVFKSIFFFGSFPAKWLLMLFSLMQENVKSLLGPTVLASLIGDGIIGGVGSVLVFLPNILLLFFFLSLLEQSGYMARVAFIMDRFMHKIGLHGRSCVPMLLGFGCTVPAIMATRTMENRRDRMAALLAMPLIGCSAKLTVFTLLIPIFFPIEWNAAILLALYAAGIVLALLIIKLLKISLFAGENAPFLIELPSYRLPPFKETLLEIGIKARQYLIKAGTVILGASILFWALSFDFGHGCPLIERIALFLQPIFLPLGFDWKLTAALLASLAAKETFISQLSILFATAGESLSGSLIKSYSTATAVSLLLFILISTPCLATFAATRQETNSWKWPVLQFSFLTLLAYCASFLVYKIISNC